MTDPIITCDGLDERLADHLEGTLPPAPRRAVEAHLAGCARCAALVRELQEITLHAAELPTLAPSRDLWAGVAERIEAPVIPLGTTTQASRATWRRNTWLGAAAAALVAVTAGVTYTITMSRVGSGTMQVAAVDSAVVPAQPEPTTGVTPDSISSTTPAPDQADRTTLAAAPAGSAVSGERREQAPAPSRGAAEPEAPSRVVAELQQTAVGHDEEITRLRRLLTERRNQLDPRTAAVLESSMAVIDQAIAQSRAALDADPASRFLVEQLNKTLEKKVELLRTAVLLPGRA